MKTQYHFVAVSGNSKTGPIPVVTSTSNTCPDTCALKTSGCYAKTGMVRMYWQRLDNGLLGVDIDSLCARISALPKGQLWRMNIAGDLAHINQWISSTRLFALIDANQGKRGFTYTHHIVQGDSTAAKHNRSLIKQANNEGFTVNLSADNLKHADALMQLNIGPVVTLLAESIDTPIKTPAGHTVVQCPAVSSDTLTCLHCKLCAVPDRKTIIGFPVHGTGKNKARQVFMMQKG